MGCGFSIGKSSHCDEDDHKHDGEMEHITEEECDGNDKCEQLKRELNLLT